MKPIIEIRNLNAGYDGRTVLRDVNLTVYDRDFLGIIGPNGGGKTTLIKCILGLLKPVSGEITFTSPRTTGNAQLTMGYLPQYNSIDRKFPITVEEVILSGLSSKKSLTSRFTKEHREKARQVIARMGLEGLEERAIGALSGGQLQRALLGRAIISDPEVVIRTSGEMRLSNYLLWQVAYSEFVATDVLWPDFDRYELLRCLLEFQSRDRRFGAVK